MGRTPIIRYHVCNDCGGKFSTTEFAEYKAKGCPYCLKTNIRGLVNEAYKKPRSKAATAARK